MPNSPSLGYSIPVFKLSQRESKNKALYVGKIKAKELCTRPEERFFVDYYKRVERMDSGYQRRPAHKAVDKIKDFILKETASPILPTAILANSRVPLEFKETNTGFGTLLIKGHPLYIIDGQHRFEAWKSLMQNDKLKELWGDFEIPIIILSGYDSVKELEQFFIVNSRQKKIKVDLAQRMLLSLSKNDETAKVVPFKEIWTNYAVVIVDAINEEIDGVWKNKIKLPGDDPDLQKAQVLWQNAFVASLKPFFSSSAPIFDIPKTIKADECAKLIASFWEIVRKYYPKTIEYPNDYAVMNTVGVYSLHILLANIIKNRGYSVKANKRDIITEAERIIARASSPTEGNYHQDFWLTGANISKELKNTGSKRYAGAYSSGSGHTRLAAGIMMNERM